MAARGKGKSVGKKSKAKTEEKTVTVNESEVEDISASESEVEQTPKKTRAKKPRAKKSRAKKASASEASASETSASEESASEASDSESEQTSTQDKRVERAHNALQRSVDARDYLKAKKQLQNLLKLTGKVEPKKQTPGNRAFLSLRNLVGEMTGVKGLKTASLASGITKNYESVHKVSRNDDGVDKVVFYSDVEKAFKKNQSKYMTKAEKAIVQAYKKEVTARNKAKAAKTKAATKTAKSK